MFASRVAGLTVAGDEDELDLVSWGSLSCVVVVRSLADVLGVVVVLPCGAVFVGVVVAGVVLAGVVTGASVAGVVDLGAGAVDGVVGEAAGGLVVGAATGDAVSELVM
jgi:hypothetical protein